MVDTFVVLGAGPAGLASALELTRYGKPVLLVERNIQVGGLSRTLQYGAFRTDIGPHRFYTKNPSLLELVRGLLGNRLLKVNRCTRFYLDGRFFQYPIELRHTLRNLGPYKGLMILGDIIGEKMKGMVSRRPPASVEEELVSRFGRTLAELNLLNYTEKVWGLHPSKLSPEWTVQRIKGLSVLEICKNMVNKEADGPKTLTDHFYYPETGIGMIYETIKDRISQRDNVNIRLSSFPTKIRHADDRIEEVIVKTGRRTTAYHPDQIISSIPITHLLAILDPPPPTDVLKACKRLRFRSHVSILITLNRRQVFPDQWIYLPEKDVPFARMAEPRNFSKAMSPPGKTSLLVEFFCWTKDETWSANQEELADTSVAWLEENGFIQNAEVLANFLHRERWAYPVYDLGYETHLNRVMEYLDHLYNLTLIGRLGRFRYNNQDHAMMMGMLAARHIVEGRDRGGIGRVGTEQQYFESDITS